MVKCETKNTKIRHFSKKLLSLSDFSVVQCSGGTTDAQVCGAVSW